MAYAPVLLAAEGVLRWLGVGVCVMVWWLECSLYMFDSYRLALVLAYPTGMTHMPGCAPAGVMRQSH